MSFHQFIVCQFIACFCSITNMPIRKQSVSFKLVHLQSPTLRSDDHFYDDGYTHSFINFEIFCRKMFAKNPNTSLNPNISSFSHHNGYSTLYLIPIYLHFLNKLFQHFIASPGLFYCCCSELIIAMNVAYGVCHNKLVMTKVMKKKETKT